MQSGNNMGHSGKATSVGNPETKLKAEDFPRPKTGVNPSIFNISTL